MDKAAEAARVAFLQTRLHLQAKNTQFMLVQEVIPPSIKKRLYLAVMVVALQSRMPLQKQNLRMPLAAVAVAQDQMERRVDPVVAVPEVQINNWMVVLA